MNIIGWADPDDQFLDLPSEAHPEAIKELVALMQKRQYAITGKEHCEGHGCVPIFDGFRRLKLNKEQMATITATALLNDPDRYQTYLDSAPMTYYGVDDDDERSQLPSYGLVRDIKSDWIHVFRLNSLQEMRAKRLIGSTTLFYAPVPNTAAKRIFTQHNALLVNESGKTAIFGTVRGLFEFENIEDLQGKSPKIYEDFELSVLDVEPNEKPPLIAAIELSEPKPLYADVARIIACSNHWKNLFDVELDMERLTFAFEFPVRGVPFELNVGFPDYYTQEWDAYSMLVIRSAQVADFECFFRELTRLNPDAECTKAGNQEQGMIFVSAKPIAINLNKDPVKFPIEKILNYYKSLRWPSPR